jgi:hypothetical protein
MELRTKEEQIADLKEMAELAEKETGNKCRKCDGSGQDGWNAQAQVYGVCICIIKAAARIRKNKFKDPVSRELLPEENN